MNVPERSEGNERGWRSEERSFAEVPPRRSSEGTDTGQQDTNYNHYCYALELIADCDSNHC